MSGGLAYRLALLFRRSPPVVAPAAPVPPAGLFAPVAAPVRVAAPESVPDAAAAPAGWRAFRLAPAQGGLLVVGGGGVLGVGAGLDAADAVVAIVPDAMPMICLLMARDGTPVSVAGDGRAGLAISARILPTDTSGAVRLKYPVAGAHFLGLRHDAAGGPSALRFDTDGNSLQSVFALQPMMPPAGPEGVQAIAGEIGRAAGRLRAGTLLALLRDGGLRPALAEPMLRLLPRDELAALARLLLAAPDDLARLGRAMAGDRWIGTCLPALAAWQARRAEVPGHVGASPAEDEAMLLAPAGQALVPAGLALHAVARRQILPRRTACLLAAACNEGPYLLDWLAYHLSIGFEHAFIYTNGNTDGSDALLELLAGHGVITLVRNARTERLGPQLKGYTHALTMLPQILDYRWAALLDIDEYLGFDRRIFASVADFLAVQESQPVDAIALCWLMYAALPEDRWSGEATTPARLQRRDRAVQSLVKSVIRPGMFWYSQPHFPTATLDALFEYRSADGGVHHHRYVEGRSPAESGAPSAEQAWVAHYMLRSAPEALLKWSRGRGDLAASHPDSMRPLDFIADRFLRLARPEHLVEDGRVVACAAGQGAVLQRLLALPGVAACDAAIKAKFAEQLAANARAFVDGGLPADASASVRGFTGIVRDSLS